MQNVAALKIPVGADIEGARHPLRILRTQNRLQLGGGPHVKAALLAIAVGIQAGEEPALLAGHLPRHEADGLLDDSPKHRAPGDQPGVDVRAGEEGVVVQHLLEVRNQPVGIHRVAMEATPQLVVHAARRHGLERVGDHFQSRRLNLPPPKGKAREGGRA